MCTKSEVREVMLETRAPAWMRYILGLLGLGAVSLLTWISLTVHAQDGNLKDLKTDMVSSIMDMRIAATVDNAVLTSKVTILSSELNSLKSTVIKANSESVTKSQIISRNTLVDERHRTFSRRLETIENDIKKQLH